MMNRWKGVVILLMGIWFSISCFGQAELERFDKLDFYRTMEDGNKTALDRQLDLIKTFGLPEKDAFEGALLMKKAGLAAGAKNKLNLFKSGHKKLELAIQSDSSRAEFRFLRLMIQEHAPAILGYRNDIKQDVKFIKSNFARLPAVVQRAVRSYSEKSIFLHPSDF